MTLLPLLAPVLSALLLAAHFFRADEPAGVAASLALLSLLAVPRRWAARAVQVALLLGSAEWVRTLLRLVAERQAAGAPHMRLSVILSLVAAFTAASSIAFQSPALLARYRQRLDLRESGRKEG